MMCEHVQWRRRHESTDDSCAALSRSWDLPVHLCRLLLNRGIGQDSLQEFLYPSSKHLHEPEALADMERAIQCFLQAVSHKQRILIYGDYDADGVTATSLILRFLRRMRYPCHYYIPHRQSEGYGLRKAAIRRASEKHIGLIITCDCGTSSFDEIRYAQSLGIQVIVTDHHKVEQSVPPEFIVVNPHRPDCSYPFPHLSGVGVAFKFCQALLPHVGVTPEELQADLDLVAIGTLADMVDLKGENRTLVSLGLDRIPSPTTSPGLAALIEASGLSDKPIGGREVSYMLAPRLNACGRLSLAKTAVKLFLAQSHQEAQELARQLNRENSRRQGLQYKMRRDAEALLKGQVGPILIVAQKGWHPGVIGLVASYLKEKYHRPAVALTISGSVARGSARSIPSFPIFDALSDCEDLLTEFGGHRLAAGFTLPAKRVSELRSRLLGIGERCLGPDDFVREMLYDDEIGFDQLSHDYVRQLRLLAPFGNGNPEPVFLSRSVCVDKVQSVGSSLRIMLFQRGVPTPFSGFMFRGNSVDGRRGIRSGDVVKVLHTPTIRTWQGRESIQLTIQSIKRENAREQTEGGRSE